MKLSTLCYIEENSSYLMMLRNKKENDVNSGKWIGPGGKFEDGESPEECVCREVYEETGLILDSYALRGVITFASEGWEDEIIFLYTADKYHGSITSCDEGDLKWIKKDELSSINLWEGDKIFLKLLAENSPFFSLKLSYKGDELVDKSLIVYE
ncbi:MAG: 8-oxo-dGTP diphosphatase [Eubacterium sp.]|nr:8-oxo-dGTP diphosphatase [Eubacterium sp.]